MGKPGNKKRYFKVMQEVSPNADLWDVVKKLNKGLKGSGNEFSIASKLLHTVNGGRTPIYDRKVRDYLTKEQGVKLWWNCPGGPKGKPEEEKIRHDWEALKKWYETFLTSEEGRGWIKWFRENFPGDAEISEIKMVDCIIFACR